MGKKKTPSVLWMVSVVVKNPVVVETITKLKGEWILDLNASGGLMWKTTEITKTFPLIAVAKKFILQVWHSEVGAGRELFQSFEQSGRWRSKWVMLSSRSSVALFALEQGRKPSSAANSLLAAPRPETDSMWSRLLLEKRKCSQSPPLEDCKLQYVYIHGFVRQSYIPLNLSVLLYCHKPNLGNVISPNWQQGLGKYNPLLCIGL